MKKILSLIAVTIFAVTLMLPLHAGAYTAVSSAVRSDWLDSFRKQNEAQAQEEPQDDSGSLIESGNTDDSGNPDNTENSGNSDSKDNLDETGDGKLDSIRDIIDNKLHGDTESSEGAETETEDSSSIERPSVPGILTPDNSSDAAPAETAENPFPIWLIVIIAAASVVLVILVIILVSGRKKPEFIIPAGSDISVEILSGLCYNTVFGFSLNEELRIGTDSDCGLVFADEAMLPVHAVISRTADGVIISEYAETGSTYVGGMKIFAPNRLRSGDIITVAGSTFRVTF